MPPRLQGGFEQPISDPSGGLNLRDAEHALRNNEFLVLENLDPRTSRGGFQVRQGNEELNSTPYRATGESAAGLYRAEDVPVSGVETSFFIASNTDGANNRIYRVNNNGTTAQIGTRTFASGADWHFATYRNIVYGVNGVDEPIRIFDDSGLAERDAGFPAPATTASGVTGSAGGLTGNYSYRFTFVYDDASAESSMSPVSNTISPSSEKIDLANIPTGAGGAGVTARNIYRTTGSGATHSFVATINDNVTTTYTDDLADGSLGDLGPNDNGIPPAGAQFIAVHKERLWMASGSTIYFGAVTSTESAPGGQELTQATSVHGSHQEHFPADFQIRVGQDDGDSITGLAVYQDHLTVFKSRSIWQIFGDNSLNFRVVKVHSGQGAASQRSIVNVENRLFFLSGGARPGVYAFDGTIPNILSVKIEPLFRDDFAFADFSSAHAARLGHLYILGYRTQSPGASPAGFADKWLVYDYTLRGWYHWILRNTSTRGLATADDFDGLLYFVGEGSTVHRFDATNTDGGQNITARLRSKFFHWDVPEREKEINRVHYLFDRPASQFNVFLHVHGNLTINPPASGVTRAIPSTGVGVRNDIFRMTQSFVADDRAIGNYLAVEVNTTDTAQASGTNIRFNLRDMVIYGNARPEANQTQT